MEQKTAVEKSRVHKMVRLIISLSINDFKKKYAGSYFGILWAFVQPVVTVLVYWFVFEKALSANAGAKGGGDTPFVVWLVAGIVPWFFFQEGITNGTNALLEYRYLVKQVVFPVAALPIIKIVSSLFVHAFFVIFTIVLCCFFGYYPDWYLVQVIYYSFCLILLVVGISYMSAAIVVFFKDLTQMIQIMLQVGIWVTPIMWDIADNQVKIPDLFQSILRLNPVYYIVNGYRGALIDKIWFFEQPGLTMYFWIFTLLLLALGRYIFEKLRGAFADVL
jgi:teichoic acid transport system permease protein